MYLKKSLGQHLLKDKKVVEFMAREGKLKSNDFVVEIGPGKGILTKQILKTGAKLLAVEKDKRLAKFLKEKFNSYKNLTILNQDILSLLEEQNSIFFDFVKEQDYKVISNLPYNVGTMIIRKFLELKKKPCLMIVMLQKEVAKKICAKGSEKRSLLTNAMQYYADVDFLKTVESEKFFPKPKVDSGIVKIFNIKYHDLDRRKDFFKLLKIGFASPRKTLFNNLKNGFVNKDPKVIKSCLKKAGLDLRVRAECLSLSEWQGTNAQIRQIVQ